jgi:hypothetical protein
MAIVQPLASFADLQPREAFMRGTPFQSAQEMRETLGAQMAATGLGVSGGLREVEEQGRNLLAAARINADSAKDIVKIQAKNNTLAARRAALAGLATGSGGLVSRFAGQAFQPPAAGLSGLAGTLGGVNGVFGGLTQLRDTANYWATPPSAIQGPIAGALRTVPPLPSFG